MLQERFPYEWKADFFFLTQHPDNDRSSLNFTRLSEKTKIVSKHVRRRDKCLWMFYLIKYGVWFPLRDPTSQKKNYGTTAGFCFGKRTVDRNTEQISFLFSLFCLFLYNYTSVQRYVFIYIFFDLSTISSPCFLSRQYVWCRRAYSLTTRPAYRQAPQIRRGVHVHCARRFFSARYVRFATPKTPVVGGIQNNSVLIAIILLFAASPLSTSRCGTDHTTGRGRVLCVFFRFSLFRIVYIVVFFPIRKTTPIADIGKRHARTATCSHFPLFVS